MSRPAIGKKTRFEVFKRDNFACVYCGNQPPKVILHCDHVIAVARGGTGDIDNLVTACDSCNLGKGARDLTAVPLTLTEKTATLKEREEQIAAFNEALAEKLSRIDSNAWDVAEVFMNRWGEDGFPKDWFASIRRFVESLPLDALLEAADIALSKFRYSKNKAFKYFCGICWRKIKRDRGEAE